MWAVEAEPGRRSRAGQDLSEGSMLLAPLIPPARPAAAKHAAMRGSWTDVIPTCARCKGATAAAPAFQPWRTCPGTCAPSRRGRVGEHTTQLVVSCASGGPCTSPTARSSDPERWTPKRGASRLRRRQEGQGAQAPRRRRHFGPAAGRGRARGRHPGRGRRRRPPQAAEAALSVAPGRVRRQRLRPARGPARLLPARADPGRDPSPPRRRGLRRGPAPVGGRADPRLARPLRRLSRLRGATEAPGRWSRWP